MGFIAIHSVTKTKAYKTEHANARSLGLGIL